MRRGELTDKAWQRIESLLPATGGKGRPWRDHRQVIDGILWRLRTGAPWRDIPERYGPWQTCYERFKRWDQDGTWARLLEEMQVKDDSVGRVEWTFSIDSTISRAHQHAAGARKRGTTAGRSMRSSRKDQALGRSRGGLTTKLHLITEARGLPMALHLTAGNVVDYSAFEAVMAKLRLPRVGPGRPRTRPDRLIGDKGYSSRKIRAYLRSRGIRAVIPERRDQIANRKRKGSRGGRPHAFDAEVYKQRNLVECCFGKLKQWRAIATRFDKLASRYLAGVTIGCLMLWLRNAELSDTL
ncbi:IS5 family transposase (plasmid) [Sphaerimonospora sp. CA-214678]|uniref:IS5 family transposase n=1 Tax=Sphaerimonospora sp. CA-214678 TaxID=3240029 RepID=UPI003D8EF62E